MQLVEGALWLDGPTADGPFNRVLTVVLVPLALLTQAWGPLLGSIHVLPVRGRRLPFFLLLLAGLALVVGARAVYQPSYTQVTPDGHLNWWSPANPPVYVAWSYALWAAVIGAPFLLWWRPLSHAAVIVSWGWLWATVSFMVSDSAASYWCFFVTFYALFLLVASFWVKDEPAAEAAELGGSGLSPG